MSRENLTHAKGMGVIVSCSNAKQIKIEKCTHDKYLAGKFISIRS